MAYQDLLKDTSEIKEDGNYFLLTINDLDINQSYPLEFRWSYKDKTFSDWSAVRVITTPGESTPGTPKLADSDVTTETPGAITVNWTGKNAAGLDLINIDRVEVYIEGSPFDGNKPTVSLKSPAKQLIFAPAGTYIVSIVAVSTWGTTSAVSNPVTVTVTGVGTTVTSPEKPTAPVILAGLASVIVEWDGKKDGGTDLTSSGFAGAKVYIGTTSDFTPSDNNWVHTLNFANGSNRISIGVGSVINKSTNAKLQYGVPYYIKLKTVNANGIEDSSVVASNPTNITVSKLPASEISTGILSADASITAGAEGGARVVVSGGPSPFVIYGTNGTTKLLEFIGGATGTLAINGSGTFTGNLSIGSGDTIFKADPTVGIWLGDADYADADFRVSTSGILRAKAGTIGGWDIGSTYLQNSAATFQINSSNSTMYIGPYGTGDHIRISASGGIQHTNSSGAATGKFTLTPNGNLTLSGAITITSGTTYDAITGAQADADAAAEAAANAAADAAEALDAAGSAIQPGNGVSLNTGAKTINTILLNSSGIKISTASSGTRLELSNSGMYLYKGADQTVSIDAASGDAFFKGEVRATSGYIGSATNGWDIGELVPGTGLYGISAADGSMSLTTGTGLGILNVGEYTVSALGGYFNIAEWTGSSYRDIITTSGVDSGDGGKIYLGDYVAGVGGRTVYVKKSAQIAGGIENANSGGLRNMFTATTTLYGNTPSIYSGALNGDVLLVYTA